MCARSYSVLAPTTDWFCPGPASSSWLFVPPQGLHVLGPTYMEDAAVRFFRAVLAAGPQLLKGHYQGLGFPPTTALPRSKRGRRAA